MTTHQGKPHETRSSTVALLYSVRQTLPNSWEHPLKILRLLSYIFKFPMRKPWRKSGKNKKNTLNLQKMGENPAASGETVTGVPTNERNSRVERCKKFLGHQERSDL